MKVTPIDGYKHIAYQEGVCRGRPTIVGTRLEPKHILNYGTIEQISEDWACLTKEQIEEAIKFENNKQL